MASESSDASYESGRVRILQEKYEKRDEDGAPARQSEPDPPPRLATRRRHPKPALRTTHFAPGWVGVAWPEASRDASPRVKEEIVLARLEKALQRRVDSLREEVNQLRAAEATAGATARRRRSALKRKGRLQELRVEERLLRRDARATTWRLTRLGGGAASTLHAEDGRHDEGDALERRECGATSKLPSTTMPASTVVRDSAKEPPPRKKLGRVSGSCSGALADEGRVKSRQWRQFLMQETARKQVAEAAEARRLAALAERVARAKSVSAHAADVAAAAAAARERADAMAAAAAAEAGAAAAAAAKQALQRAKLMSLTPSAAFSAPVGRAAAAAATASERSTQNQRRQSRPHPNAPAAVHGAGVLDNLVDAAAARLDDAGRRWEERILGLLDGVVAHVAAHAAAAAAPGAAAAEGQRASAGTVHAAMRKRPRSAATAATRASRQRDVRVAEESAAVGAGGATASLAAGGRKGASAPNKKGSHHAGPAKRRQDKAGHRLSLERATGGGAGTAASDDGGGGGVGGGGCRNDGERGYLSANSALAEHVGADFLPPNLGERREQAEGAGWSGLAGLSADIQSLQRSIAAAGARSLEWAAWQMEEEDGEGASKGSDDGGGGGGGGGSDAGDGSLRGFGGGGGNSGSSRGAREMVGGGFHGASTASGSERQRSPVQPMQALEQRVDALTDLLSSLRRRTGADVSFGGGAQASDDNDDGGDVFDGTPAGAGVGDDDSGGGGDDGGLFGGGYDVDLPSSSSLSGTAIPRGDDADSKCGSSGWRGTDVWQMSPLAALEAIQGRVTALAQPS
ncbi:unnamed protein product [Phaeothamnion confervicola]